MKRRSYGVKTMRAMGAMMPRATAFGNSRVAGKRLAGVCPRIIIEDEHPKYPDAPGKVEATHLFQQHTETT